jgi:hypothetical protein
MSTQVIPSPAPRLPPSVRRALMALAGIAALTMIAAAALGLLDLAARHTTERRATYDDVRSLVIDGASDVRLTGAPAGTPLSLVSHVTEGLRTPHPRVRRHGDGVLRLSANCPGLFGGSCNVRYEIAVPAGTLVQDVSTAGDIRVEHLRAEGPLTLHSSAGDVSVDGVRSPALSLSSSAGDVDARDVDADRVKGHSSAGDVFLALLRPANRLDADSSAGDVELLVPDVAYHVDAGSSAGDVDDSDVRTDPDAPRAINAHSSAGDVRITRR